MFAMSDSIGVVKSVSALNYVRERKSGRMLGIVRLLFGDESGTIPVCLWNEMVTVTVLVCLFKELYFVGRKLCGS